MRLDVSTFVMGTDKDVVVKVLEEASEVHGAWQDRGLDALADEIADCIQACCNLAARYDIDVDAAMRRCELRNHRRGRYGPGGEGR